MPRKQRRFAAGSACSSSRTTTIPEPRHSQIQRPGCREQGQGRGVGGGFENFHIQSVKCGGKACFPVRCSCYTQNSPLLPCATSLKVIYHQPSNLLCFLKRTIPASGCQISTQHPLIRGVGAADRQLSGCTDLTLLYMCRSRISSADLGAH